MKTIWHSDYWSEIPAGEFLAGLSDEQRHTIAGQIRKQVGYERFPAKEQQLIESAASKFRQKVESITDFYQHFWKREESQYPLQSIGLNAEEKGIVYREAIYPIILVEETLSTIPYPISSFVDRFYISKFPLTTNQYHELTHGSPVGNIPGALDEPGERKAAPVKDLSVCEAMGARVPTWLEWEKAARGTDGRLYPWGNEFDPQAGFFFYGQGEHGLQVDAFPRGVSPYGLWGMAGGLPETVRVVGRNEYNTSKGCHAKESSAAMAWFDHITALPGRGDWVSLRPVLDKWPQQQWQGIGPNN